MNNRFAIYFGIVLVLAIMVDLIANGGGYIIFWGKQLSRAVEWLAFWR
ncbi:MAG: hypothetical protein GY952_03540 [Rhodobacteraceae bacterium]|nr:hypothetical protein [Paracoccaceae bacterium]